MAQEPIEDLERPKTPFDNLLEDLEGIVKDNSKLGTLAGSPRGLAKIQADFSSNPNAHLFENIYAIEEEDESKSYRSRESIEEEEKHEDLDEGGPGIYEKDSLGSYNSEEAKEEEPDEEMDFDDVN